MQQEDIGVLFIKHYNNLKKLSLDQLEAIKEEKLELVSELIAQKQVIMDSFVVLQNKFDINECQPEIKEKLKELLSQIAVTEKESQQILSERCTDISRKMIAGRKEFALQQAYEDHSFQGHGIMLNIKR